MQPQSWATRQLDSSRSIWQNYRCIRSERTFPEFFSLRNGHDGPRRRAPIDGPFESGALDFFNPATHPKHALFGSRSLAEYSCNHLILSNIFQKKVRFSYLMVIFNAAWSRLGCGVSWLRLRFDDFSLGAHFWSRISFRKMFWRSKKDKKEKAEKAQRAAAADNEAARHVQPPTTRHDIEALIRTIK